jgi:hypothetical protein
MTLALVSDIDNLEEDGSQVTLMTLHAAKGIGVSSCFPDWLRRRGFPAFPRLDGRKRIRRRTTPSLCRESPVQKKVFI